MLFITADGTQLYKSVQIHNLKVVILLQTTGNVPPKAGESTVLIFQEPEGSRVKAPGAVVILLRAHGNAESGVLRLLKG
jgi:hypothetical protein